MKSDKRLCPVDLGSLRAASVVSESDLRADFVEKPRRGRRDGRSIHSRIFYAAEDFPILIFRTRIKGLPRRQIPFNGSGASKRGHRNLIWRHNNTMRISSAQEYEDRLRNCTLCAPLLSQRQVDPAVSTETVRPRPIVRTPTPKPVMLIGQAPGLTEYRTNTPFSGQAGQDIRALFQECGFGPSQFERHVFTSAVAKCFPGSKLTKRRRGEGFRREDHKPSTAMLANCRPYLLAQLQLVCPRVVVLLGGMALEAYIELRTGKRSKPSLAEYVGKVEVWEGRRVVPLAHTSGGSFWLNDPANRALQAEAKRLLSQELAALPQCA